MWFIVNVIVMDFLDDRKNLKGGRRSFGYNSATIVKNNIEESTTISDIIISIKEEGEDEKKNSIPGGDNMDHVSKSANNITNIPSSSFPKLEVPSSSFNELCLVTSWGQGKLPDYAYSMFDSVVNNRDYVKLLVFHHKTTNLPDPKTRRQRYSNIDFIDISDLAEDGSYKEAGFPRFLTDRICGLYNETRFSMECERLYAALGFLEYQKSSAPGIVQGERWIRA